MNTTIDNTTTGDVAIIGMSGRFPGAQNIEQFWHNLINGVESISHFTDQELIAAGIDPSVLTDPSYVKAKGILENVETFDATFFGYSAREAEIMDPQQRLFLECAWEALENAGYGPPIDSMRIGVYGGASSNGNTYLLTNLYPNLSLRKSVGDYSLVINNERDFLCTRVSYKLNLTGPSVTVQTACSTSLVAVVLGCQSLLNYQCDIVLAGGAAISLPIKAGYFYQEGMILSPDGHCRAFDAKAQGTVGGNGVGLIVLKRLAEALADGDHIYAVIKGAAVNNDGALKLSYLAPSVEGQARVIVEALALAEIPAATITYVEAHGTATLLGDPNEIAALTQAFRSQTDKTGYCAIGAVKTNIGHLDVAAGVTGLIKTALALKYQLIPPSLHFNTPNPNIDFANSPFYVNTELSEWRTKAWPRRAGVSSFGIGGTNAHLILEESPVPMVPMTHHKTFPVEGENLIKPRSVYLLPLSAKTATALDLATTRILEHLQQHPELNLADVAYTYQVGRGIFNHRRLLLGQTFEEVIKSWAAKDPQTIITHQVQSSETPAVVFMFTGQGAQYVNMGRELYQTETVFRTHLDYGAEFLKPILGIDLRTVLYGGEQQEIEQNENYGGLTGGELLKQTALTQPALFVIEYALAQLWMSWGIMPAAMIGHSIGEYVAACLAGVFTVNDALTLVAARGRLMQSVAPGAMLAVPLTVADLQPLLPPTLDLATINIPSQSVISGPIAAIEEFATQLAQQGIACTQIHTSHAFHSQMMSPILAAFLAQVQAVSLHPPRLPYLSNVTGTWIQPSEATDPQYWVKQLRQTVQFAPGLQHLFTEYHPLVLLEVGPGHTLSSFAKRHPALTSESVILSCLPPAKEAGAESAFLLTTLGRLWLAGVKVNWSAFHGEARRQRLPLPTYPFERQHYWVEPPSQIDRPLTVLPAKNWSEPRWEALTEAAQGQAQSGLAAFDNAIYRAKYEGLNRLSVAYVNRACQELGLFSHSQEKYSVEQLLQQGSILPVYQQLFTRCLDALVAQEQLQQEEGMFSTLRPSTGSALTVLLEEVKRLFTDMPEWVELVQCCGEKYAAILTGKVAPRQLLFTGPTFEILQTLYKNSPESRYFNAMIQAIMQQIVKFLPAGNQLRILEIGAGTGATTQCLLADLPVTQTSYTFTDVGMFFLEQAQQRFSAYPFVQYRRLDIEQSCAEQGYENHSFDVIIAANVLHATRNLEKSLQQVRTLLAPEGLLLLWETTSPMVLHFDVAFPLLQPYESDSIRSRYPFPTLEQWCEALKNYDWVKVAVFPKVKVLDDHLLIAQAAASATLPAAFTAPIFRFDNLRKVVKSSDSRAPVGEVQQFHSRTELRTTYVAPSNETEQRLAEVWQTALGVERIGRHDNFFELGGDSLIAVQLMAKLRQTFQIDLPVHSLLEVQTIAGLADIIQSKRSATTTLPPCLVKIGALTPDSSPRGRGEKSSHQSTPVFLVHPAGGHVYIYRDIAQCLAPNYLVYGLQAQGVDGQTQPLTSVEAMATQYIEALQVIQPAGPYRLGGASFGGVVAFEMAQQLRSQGHHIAWLALLDTPSPLQLPMGLDNDIDILVYLLNMDQDLSLLANQIRQLEDPVAQLNYFLARGQLVNKLFPESSVEQLRHFLYLFKVNVQAMRNYRPSQYVGRILFFRATEVGAANPANPERSWFDLATEGVEVVEVPGNHITMNYLPQVTTIAERLKKYAQPPPTPP